MLLLKSDLVRFDELPAALICLPEACFGLDKIQTLALWRQWHQQGSLQIGRIYSVHPDGTTQTEAMGITTWITDEAVAALAKDTQLSRTQLLYQSAAQGAQWVMQAADIRQAHDKRALNLMILHFWTRSDVSKPEFHPVFLQAHASFRDIHQGFGVQTLLQEVPLEQAPFLTAAGLQTIHTCSDSAFGPLAWMGITQKDAVANPGSTLSFLFFSPERRLKLKPAVQRMLALAFSRNTDDDIACELGCSRDYVRKLWGDAYADMEQAGVLAPLVQQAPSTSAPVRGPERRRTALEFLRGNPHELRPGIANNARTDV